MSDSSDQHTTMSKSEDYTSESMSSESSDSSSRTPQNPHDHSLMQPIPHLSSEEQSASGAGTKRPRRDQDSMQTPPSIPPPSVPNRRSLSPLPLPSPIQETSNNRTLAVLVSPDAPVARTPGQELVSTPTQPPKTPDDEELVLCSSRTMCRSYGNNTK